jgi:UDP-N-acetylglucosamine--N-acetylmuramyl-(pentapeptide) pyrophosphoryl-undecaprenol N-acetylglucosamine transferase
MVSVVIAGGGTGGHVFPMLAVGDAVKALAPGAAVTYVGTAKGIEARVVPERGDRLELLDIRPLRGGGIGGFAKGVWFAARSIPSARALLRGLAPDVVLSVGGYAGGPVALAARSLGVPVTMMEPNSVVGLSNRLLGPLAVRAYTAFPETERQLRPDIVRRLGVPLRAAFEPRRYEAKEPLEVLVIGGSQGAAALNETVPRALALSRRSLRVVHQTGQKTKDEVSARYAELGLEARVVPFIQDVAGALAAADLVVSRSGASSLAEICAVGRPSLLVPYPFAADDHQYRNAKSLEDAGAAIALRQSDATAERIASEIARLDPQRLAAMAEKARERGKPEAARLVAEDLLELAREHAAKRGGSSAADDSNTDDRSHREATCSAGA